MHEENYNPSLMNIQDVQGMTRLFLDLDLLTLKDFNYLQFNMLCLNVLSENTNTGSEGGFFPGRTEEKGGRL